VIGSVKYKALRRYIEMDDRQGLPPDCVARLKRLVSAWVRLKAWMNWERFRVGGCLPLRAN
jgi:hypothetical protein